MKDGNTLLGGVIEGFYGRPWSQEQRMELFPHMAAWGLDTYVYGPKDDLKLRAEWRSLYSADEEAALRMLFGACLRAGLQVNYAIAPGLDMNYADPADTEALHRKVRQLIGLGVRDFTLLFDDIPPDLPEAARHMFRSFAHAQYSVANDLLDFIRHESPEARLWFCPTEYCDRRSVPNAATSPYLSELGEHLHPDIDVFWTGPEIVSETISVEDARRVGKVLRRKPLIWDNFHANDYDIRRVYLGPLAGRDPGLTSVIRGIISNPNCEFEANFIPLYTLGLYLADPSNYEPAAAYAHGLEEWLPRFALHEGDHLTLEEVRLLGDLHYLPFQAGEQAGLILELSQAVLDGAKPSPGSPELLQLGDLAKRVSTLFERLTHLENRELLHAVYEYMWEANEEVSLLHGYAAARAEGRERSFRQPDPVPNTYRGGLAAEIQRRLPLEKGLITYRRPAGHGD